MTNPSVSYEEILRASFHEAGHSMISAEVGVHVYFALVHRDGSGFSQSDVPFSPVKDLKLTLGGYIAEAIGSGEVPTFEAMVAGRTNEDDVADVERILGDKRIKAEIAFPKAFEFVVKFFSMPANYYRLVHLAKKLARTRYLDGHYFNPRGA